MPDSNTLVDALRHCDVPSGPYAAFSLGDMCREAADEIETLENRLLVQEQYNEAATNRIDELQSTLKAKDDEIAQLREALIDWRNSWLCPVGPFDGDRLVRATDSVIGIEPIAGEYDD